MRENGQRSYLISISFCSFLVFGDLKIVTQELWCWCASSEKMFLVASASRKLPEQKTNGDGGRDRLLKVTGTNPIPVCGLESATRAGERDESCGKKGGKNPLATKQTPSGSRWPSCRPTHLHHRCTGPKPSTTHKKTCRQ